MLSTTGKDSGGLLMMTYRPAPGWRAVAFSGQFPQGFY